MWPQIQAVFRGQTPIERSTMNSWDDENFVAAVKKTGRKKIVLAGLWTETCVALPTVQAIHDGYEVYVVEDCCGDVSQLSHDNAMKRVIQAGAKPVTALSVMLEWQRDWALATPTTPSWTSSRTTSAPTAPASSTPTRWSTAHRDSFPGYEVPEPAAPTASPTRARKSWR